MNKYPISDTSALVLLWLKNNIYESDISKDFLSKIDLSSGDKLYKQCNNVWENYDQVIINRKFCISNLISQHLNNGFDQLIIAGAGLAPLSIETSFLFPNVKIFDLDKYNMELKQRIYEETIHGKNDKIKFITVDIEKLQDVIEALTTNGLDFKKKSILLLEGISYYISFASIKSLIDLLPKESTIIIEYLVPYDDIREEYRSIPQEVFGIISNNHSLNNLTHLDVALLSKQNNLNMKNHFTMSQIEKERTNQNKYFKKKNSGWIEISDLSRGV